MEYKGVIWVNGEEMSLLVLPLGPVCVPVPDGKYPLVPVNVPGIDVGYTIT